MMLFTKNSAGTALTSAAKLLTGPFDTAVPSEQTELSVPTAPGTAQLVPSFIRNSNGFAILKNTSPAAQQIRFSAGAIPSFTPVVTGQLLAPGQEVVLPNIAIGVIAVADIAGALCSRFIVRTSRL